MPRIGIKRSASLYVSKSHSENSENHHASPAAGKKAFGDGSKRLALGLNTSILNLSINDCTCPICLEILVEPVQMPCRHEVCLPCFKAMTDKTNFHCPMCRMRISTWSRAASNSNTLVNQQRWEQIQRAFPKEIRDRVEGKTASILAESMKKDKETAAASSGQQEQQTHHHQPVAEPGAIRREYEEYLRREQERIRAEQETEEKLSLDLIQRVLREEDAVTLDDYVRLVERTAAGPTTSAGHPPATRTHDATVNRIQAPPAYPPPPPPTQEVSVIDEEQAPPPPVPPRIATAPRVARMPHRAAPMRSRIDDLIDDERHQGNATPPSTSASTSTSTESAEVSNIKLRLRPSIKRQVRPVVARKAAEDKEAVAAADSSLDMSSSAADTTVTTGTLDRRLRGHRAQPTSSLATTAVNQGLDDTQESTPALPKRRMSLRRSTRV